MRSGDRRYEKEFFTPVRLPVIRKYLYPGGRGRLFAAGVIAMVVVMLPFLAGSFFGRATVVTNGDLSASHALFGKDCATCHSPLEGVPDAKCKSCHEKLGDALGTYSFAHHYLYRSADFDRSAPATREGSCASCHTEHKGREVALGQVADARCQSCHTFGSFRRGHPEFAFAGDGQIDRSNLRFPHVLHVREITEERGLGDLEESCFSCHQPQSDGRSFQPISFERHCDACHLTTRTATPYLPVRQGSSPGVRTLTGIRREGGAASLWAEYTDPNEFREVGGQIQKRPVQHEDPWILYNLNLLRAELYPGAELAELLRASGDVPAEKGRVLHDEAVTTLRSRIQALRGASSPDVQAELKGLTELLDLVERRLEDPYAPIDRTRFDVRVADRAEGFDTGTLDAGAYASVIDSLTARCQTCHLVERATIARVQKDQRTLQRAEFDHRAHIIHTRCLDCHTAIPVEEYVYGPDNPPAALDQANIQNLPTIATCRSCHSDDGAGDRCTSCHVFHPEKSPWSNRSRYLHPVQ